MQEMKALLHRQLEKYPGMQAADCVKLLFQACMGPGHLVKDEAAFLEHLRRELAIPGLMTAQPDQPEELGPVYSRAYLTGFESGPTAQTFARMCTVSAAAHPGDEQGLKNTLALLREEAKSGALPFAPDEINTALDELAAGGQPHHSERYRALYQPHYRVLARDMAFYLPVFAAVDAALAQGAHVLVGIDGMSGAGKSVLAELLHKVYACGVVHTDDFFLQQHQRTEARLQQPGGNIDYERLAPVAARAADDRAFRYQRYDCRTGTLEGQRDVPAGRLAVLEGVYSLHPEVAAACDVRVFLSVDAAVQAKRVRERSGKELARRFEEEWIPMENQYFAQFQIRESCTVQLDTSTL